MEILSTKTDIGLVRDTNEDCAIAITHPKDSKIKLLIVADGMGGKSHGDIASNYVASTISKWFLNKEPQALNSTKKINELLIRYIKVINTNLIKKYGENVLGTTLTLALINRSNTIILNSGDSRCYIYQENKLTQITEDQSAVWDYHKYGGVNKDDLRYFANNNVISSCIGLFSDFCHIESKIIKNNYQIIMLFTDGVTDLITDKKIKQLIKKSKKEELLNNIVYEAVHVNQYLFVPARLKKSYLGEYITPFKGRDNATGVIYIKDV